MGDGGGQPGAARVRNFGPDAAPTGKRKNDAWAAKGPKAPKGPIKEVGRRGSLTAADDDDDSAVDDRPFWEVADTEADSEEEEGK
jgi:hypothetical protein